jgi:4-aminobutyrate aminotransferase-like enzyme
MATQPRCLDAIASYLQRAQELNQRYRDGLLTVRVPEEWAGHDRPLDELVAAYLPASHAALEDACQSLFFSLPIAFDPAECVGPYLATVDRDPEGEPFRFIDLGAQIATQAFGENDSDLVAAVLAEPAFVVNRFAHCEYQTSLSLRLKARLDSIAPKGTPRHFVVNTGAETVENGMKAVLLSRVRSAQAPESGYFVISFDGAFHGRTLGCLAVTQRKRAKAGFPTFDWPHVPFPAHDPDSLQLTERREQQALRKLWELIVTGRMATAPRSREAFARDLELVDSILAGPAEDVSSRCESASARLNPDALRRARRVAGVLVEPIQGEGGVRVARPTFFRRLRVLTRLYDVPLLFDEVQTGGGMTGTFWAHEQFELPIAPDAVMWAKKAQNGVLFVSEELAEFFQEEKKFNTTWEGDSVGMLRLLAMLDKLDLGQARATGASARAQLERLASQYHSLIHHVRGAGCMLAFDVARPDLRDTVRDRCFRRGLILLPAGERTLRFYPRFDMTAASLREAIELLREAIEDLQSGRSPTHPAGPERRVGAFALPRARIQLVPFDAEGFESLRDAIMAVETARYGVITQYPVQIHQPGHLPLLQYPVSSLQATMGNPRAIGLALRDALSKRIVAYALGSPLENYEEEGVQSDPRLGECNTFYLQAMATLPSVKNDEELESVLLEAMRHEASGLGYDYLSTLIEAKVRDRASDWMREATELQAIDDYLGSGVRFVYVSVALGAGAILPTGAQTP